MKYEFPLDPECPVVSRTRNDLLDDPMTSHAGAPVDEILEDFARKHRQSCERCRDFGLANVEVA